MASELLDEKAIFNIARQIGSPDARAEYLGQACGTDSGLRERVQVLLRAYEEQASFLESPPPVGVAPTIDQAASESPGTVIGPYKLIEQIGEGGMGTVWMAQQTEPVKRLVALKLIKAGMDSKQVIARFEAERQALAIMDHPNIAKVLDAGTTELAASLRDAIPGRGATGLPYFVMELVKGVPITKYCDEHRLTPRQRLELFIPVCQAVQHAHQKGIIHRDLKPSNVLVALYDGKPVPKVIDFGVAKAAGQPLTEQTLVTGFGAIVGTLEYMSPEQAEVNQLDIDTRSDIYSLGVLLYELLAGSTPFSRKELEKAGMLEMLRVIREQEPSKPSTKLSSSEALPTLSANRGTEPAKLTKLVRGELDWIVMKALEKDRNRRYETANGFSMDVQRYLAGEVVQACPPSAAYRFKKFVRRNRGTVLTTVAMAAALVTGTALASWQAVVATQAKRDTLAALEKEEHARAEAQTKEAEANAVLKFFEVHVFAAGRPKGEGGGLGHEVSLRDAVLASLPALATSFKNQPLVEARLRTTLGATFLHLGKANQALEQFEQTRTLRTRHLGPEHPDTLASMHNLATSYSALGRHAEALKLFQETLEISRRVLPKDDPDTLKSMNNLAISYDALGRHAEALKLREETLEIQRRVLPKDHPDTLGSMNNLATSYSALGRRVEALKLREETLEIQRRVLPKDHRQTLTSMHNLALSYLAQERPAEALKLFQETLEIFRRVLPKDHPRTLTTMMNLASCYYALGRHAEALKLYQETLEIFRRVLPKDHPETLKCMTGLANSYFSLGRRSEALKLREETLKIQRRVLPKDHSDTLRSMGLLAESYYALDRHAEALKLREEMLEICRRVLPKDHPATRWSMDALAKSYYSLDRHAEALKLREEMLEIRRRALPKDHPETLARMMDLASSYSALGRHAKALKLREETLEIQRRVLPKDDPDTLVSIANLADSYVRAKRYDEALKLVEEFLPKADTPGVERGFYSQAIATQVQCYQNASDLAGCRSTAKLQEKRNPSDALSLYTAAYCRAITAAVQAKTPGADSARLANVEAEKAMAWLTKAVAAGWKDAVHLKKDPNFKVLRDRDDFKKLIAELEAKSK